MRLALGKIVLNLQAITGLSPCLSSKRYFIFSAAPDPRLRANLNGDGTSSLSQNVPSSEKFNGRGVSCDTSRIG